MHILTLNSAPKQKSISASLRALWWKSKWKDWTNVSIRPSCLFGTAHTGGCLWFGSWTSPSPKHHVLYFTKTPPTSTRKVHPLSHSSASKAAILLLMSVRWREWRRPSLQVELHIWGGVHAVPQWPHCFLLTQVMMSLLRVNAASAS